MLIQHIIPGDTVVLIGADRVMMNSWLVDLFSSKIKIHVCDIVVVIKTSAVNCGISSNILHYIFMKSHPRIFSEVVKLMGRLKCGIDIRLTTDWIHLLLLISNFSLLLYSFTDR